MFPSWIRNKLEQQFRDGEKRFQLCLLVEDKNQNYFERETLLYYINNFLVLLELFAGLDQKITSD